MTTQIQPLDDRIVVQVVDDKEEVRGGIIIPTTVQDKTGRGIVVAVGPGRMNETTGVRMDIGLKAGDVVLFNRYAGNEFRENGLDFLIMDTTAVFARVAAA